MMPVVDGFETLRRIRATPGIDDIPVIFLSAKSQIEDRVDGLRMGADDYLIKPADPKELMARIDSVMLRSRRTARRIKGKVFGFVGAKGGVGVTTVVTNMAIYLHQTGKSILAADMHLAFGGLADRLGMDPPQTTANLALLPAESIDSNAVQRTISRHSSGLTLLGSPSNVPAGVTYSAEHLISITDEGAYTAQLMLLDLPNDPDIVEVIADELSGIVLVLGSEPTSLRAAARWGQHLDQLGLRSRLSALLVHRQGASQQYATEANVSESLGCLVLGEIPYKPELYGNAEQTRMPMMLSVKDSPERTIYQNIAQKLTDYTDILEQFHKQERMKSPRLD